MTRAISLFASLSVLLAVGCQKDDKSMEAALKRIDDRLKNIEDKMEKGVPTRAGAAGAAARGARAPQGRPPGPDPESVYAMPIEGDPFVGPADAKVTIVKGYDFACPFCMRVRPTLETLLEQYKGDVRVVYKNLIVHPGSATIPAMAGCAAAQQGKFHDMYMHIWDDAFSKGRDLSKEKMVAIAKELGLDAAKFEKDLEGETCKKLVAQDQQDLRKVGARGTPAFFINGRFLSGARPIDQFKKLVDEELAKANDRIKKGASKDRYYAEWVVAKGKKTL